MRYKFHTLYELDNLAVVNVKDTNVVKNAFKLLMFPDTRLFQAESPKAKVSLHVCFCNIYCAAAMQARCSHKQSVHPSVCLSNT